MGIQDRDWYKNPRPKIDSDIIFGLIVLGVLALVMFL